MHNVLCAASGVCCMGCVCYLATCCLKIQLCRCVPRQETQKKLPEMYWSKVDLRQLAKHKETSSALGQHNGPNARRTLRKMDTSKRNTGSSRFVKHLLAACVNTVQGTAY